MIEIEEQRNKKKEKKKKLEYKSKVALYNIISQGRGGGGSRLSQEEQENQSKLPEWKIGLRTGHTYQQSPFTLEEENKSSSDLTEIEMSEDR